MDNSRIISKNLPAPFVLMSGSGLTCLANRCLIPALQGSGFAGLIQSRSFALNHAKEHS